MVDDWAAKLKEICASGTGATCKTECSALPGIEAQCGWSGKDGYPTSCLGACGNYQAAEACFNCRKADSAGVPPELANSNDAITFWCAPDSCWQTCMRAADKVNKNCDTIEPCKAAMCSGEAKGWLDQCNSCVSNAPIDTSFRDAVYVPLQLVDAICKDTPPDCVDQCVIMDINAELCSSQDPAKCAGMCAVSCNPRRGRGPTNRIEQQPQCLRKVQLVHQG